MTIFSIILLLLAPNTTAAALPASAHATASPSPAPLTPDELFSRRAMRRARLLIQMRMMQLRDERLECVREALLRRLPSALWPEEPSPSRGVSNAASAETKCEELLRF